MLQSSLYHSIIFIGTIEWGLPVKRICRFIDALGFPYHGARAFLDKEEVIIEKVCEHKNLYMNNRDVGKILFIKKSNPIIVCKDGLIEIKSARYKKIILQFFL